MSDKRDSLSSFGSLPLGATLREMENTRQHRVTLDYPPQAT